MVIEYTPHAAQMEIHRAREARFRTVCTGRRFGQRGAWRVKPDSARSLFHKRIMKLSKCYTLILIPEYVAKACLFESGSRSVF